MAGTGRPLHPQGIRSLSKAECHKIKKIMNHVSKEQTSKEDTNPSGPNGGSEYGIGDVHRKLGRLEKRDSSHWGWVCTVCVFRVGW